MIDKKTKWSYCVGATGRDAAYTLVSMFVMTYVQYTMKLTGTQFAVISAAMVICMIWDAINDLLMSSIIENSKLKMGKYRPFILLGAALNAIVIIAMFWIRPSGWGFVAFFCVSYLLWGMTYTINDIAYWGMLPSLSSDPKERDSLVTLMGIFVCIGQFTVAGIVPEVITGNAVMAFRVVALIAALGFLLFQTLTFWGVTEKERSDNPGEVTFKTMFRVLKRNDQLLHSGIAYILFCAGQQLLLLLGTNFFFFEFMYSKGGDFITLFTVMYGLGTLLAQVVYPMIAKKASRLKLYGMCMIALVLGYLVLLSVGYVLPKSPVIIMAAGFVIFFAQGLINLAMVVMINNTIEYDELRFGERHDSIISAIRSFASKFSGALNQGCASAILLVSGLYEISQNISDLENMKGRGELTREEVLSKADYFISTAEDGQRLILRIGMVAVPLVVMIIAYIIVKKKYTISESEYNRIVAEIEKNRKVSD